MSSSAENWECIAVGRIDPAAQGQKWLFAIAEVHRHLHKEPKDVGEERSRRIPLDADRSGDVEAVNDQLHGSGAQVVIESHGPKARGNQSSWRFEGQHVVEPFGFAADEPGRMRARNREFVYSTGRNGLICDGGIFISPAEIARSLGSSVR